MASATVDRAPVLDLLATTAYTHTYRSPLLLREEGAKPAARPVSVFLAPFSPNRSQNRSRPVRPRGRPPGINAVARYAVSPWIAHGLSGAAVAVVLWRDPATA